MSIRQMNNLSLSECLPCQIVIGNKKGDTINLFRTSSRNLNESECLVVSLENLVNDTKNWNIAFTIMLGDFNASSKSWSVRDITKSKKTQFESISSLYGLLQLIAALYLLYLIYEMR